MEFLYLAACVPEDMDLDSGISIIFFVGGICLSFCRVRLLFVDLKLFTFDFLLDNNLPPCRCYCRNCNANINWRWSSTPHLLCLLTKLVFPSSNSPKYVNCAQLMHCIHIWYIILLQTVLFQSEVHRGLLLPQALGLPMLTSLCDLPHPSF